MDKDLLWFKLGAISQVEDKSNLLTDEEIAGIELLLPIDRSMNEPREIVLLTANLYIVIIFDDTGENVEITRYSRDRKIRKINKKFAVIKHPGNKSYWQRYDLTMVSIVFEDGEILEIKQPDPHYLHDYQKLVSILEKDL